MNLDQDRLCVELQRLDWARTLDANAIQDIAAAGKMVEFQAGQAVIERHRDVEEIYFVLTGKLEGSLFDQLGKMVHRDSFSRGSVVGLFSTFLADQSNLHVVAAEHTIAIQLQAGELLRLTAKHREFQRAMFCVAANIVKHLAIVDRVLAKPAVVAVIHQSESTRQLTVQLARQLRRLGESPCVASDNERSMLEEGIPSRLLYENGVSIGADAIRGLLEEWKSHGRLFLDLRAEHAPDELNRLLSYSETVLWCIEPKDVPVAEKTLKALNAVSPRLHEKVCLVWALKHDAPTPPYSKDLYDCAARQFKTHSGTLKPHQNKLLEQGIDRIVRYLRGVQIGLALGGGAARGMAHLGVLKALEHHGIYVDMIAGTSAGAMVGGVYAAGLDPEYATDCFKRDLLPPRFFRQLPGGGYWYLLYKYRRRQFGPMLRRYLGDLRMEQLVIPTMMLSADLAEGVSLVRDRGDVTNNILESINLPPLSLPIIESDQAVVDGGLLNNVPADVLVSKGCNFVIASTVTAKLEKDFMGIRSRKKGRLANLIATIQVMMRQSMIQSYNMNAMGVAPADVVISPDVTSFDMSEFTRADEMAVSGEIAANTSVLQIKEMLARLDPRMFGGC